MGFDTSTFTKAITGKGQMMLDWRNWLYGLVSGTVGGAASAGSAQLALAVSKGLGLDVHVLNWKELGIVCLTGGLVSAFAFLKQSPLPPKEQITTVTTGDVHIEETKVSPPPTP